MNDLLQQRCFNHRGREAVARCPRCGRFFCRECVTEHGGRVVCAGCLRALAARRGARQRRWHAARLAAACGLGLAAAWLVFYGVGRLLMRIPAPVHEGTLWREDAADD